MMSDSGGYDQRRQSVGTQINVAGGLVIQLERGRTATLRDMSVDYRPGFNRRSATAVIRFTLSSTHVVTLARIKKLSWNAVSVDVDGSTIYQQTIWTASRPRHLFSIEEIPCEFVCTFDLMAASMKLLVAGRVIFAE